MMGSDMGMGYATTGFRKLDAGNVRILWNIRAILVPFSRKRDFPARETEEGKKLVEIPVKGALDFGPDPKHCCFLPQVIPSSCLLFENISRQRGQAQINMS
jgi:hypothetical protein